MLQQDLEQDLERDILSFLGLSYISLHISIPLFFKYIISEFLSHVLFLFRFYHSFKLSYYVFVRLIIFIILCAQATLKCLLFFFK